MKPAPPVMRMCMAPSRCKQLTTTPDLAERWHGKGTYICNESALLERSLAPHVRSVVHQLMVRVFYSLSVECVVVPNHDAGIHQLAVYQRDEAECALLLYAGNTT